MKKALLLFSLLLSVTVQSQGWESIATGFKFSIGIKDDGTLWGWGWNNRGQVGNGTTDDAFQPVLASSDTDWVKVSCGHDFALAQKADGTLWGWGFNGGGQLGFDLGGVNALVPTQINTDTDWVSFSAGTDHALAVKSNGTLWGWGDGDESALTQALSGSFYVPTQIGTATNWSKVSAGEAHSIAIKTDGTLWGWGKNYNNQASTSSFNFIVNNPTQNGTATDWVSVRAGYRFSFGVKANGSLWSWGQNNYGQLGDGTLVGKAQPTAIAVGTTWAKVISGTFNSMGITTDGKVYSWGRNSAGQIGNGNIITQTTPYQIGTATDWQDIATGYHAMMINTNGQLYGWGSNSNGENGTNSAGDIYTPTLVSCEILSTQTPSLASKFSLYPLPAHETVFIDTSETDYMVTVYDAFGRLLFQQEHMKHWSVASLPSGVYLFEITIADERMVFKVPVR